jgi:hypothetical protein
MAMLEVAGELAGPVNDESNPLDNSCGIGEVPGSGSMYSMICLFALPCWSPCLTHRVNQRIPG